MAAEVTTMPGVNGYAPHQGYGGIEQQQQYNTNAYNQNTAVSQAAYTPAPPANSTPVTAASSQPEISKDEVGWYFVEQYYTTLSRSPEKLYLFYNKRSQLVSGNETEKVDVCVGQRAINDKIKELDFQDCKVRVTNVDSQASDSNIVIQVIGEISNKSKPHRKFTQTFVLATQTNGYFVLNDIFRYLIEEEDEQAQQRETEKVVPQQPEEVQQAVPAAESSYPEPAPKMDEAEPKTLTSSMDPKAIERDAHEVDKELEQKAKTEPAAVTNGTPVPEQAPLNHAEKIPAAAVNQQEEPVAETAAPELAREDTAEVALEPEKPIDPSPSPVTAPAVQQAPPQPAAPPKPAVPKTWASLAAMANKSGVPVPPAAAQTQQQQQQQPRPQPPAAKPVSQTSTTTAAPAQAQTSPAAPAAQRDESTAAAAQDEWTSVTSSHARQQSRAQSVQQEQVQNRGYIKNVHDGVDSNALKEHLKQFGELAYFDVAPQKNCAFVDFVTSAGYTAAVAANPHQIGSERLFVEERRIRPGSTPYVPRGQFQGGRGGRGGMQGAPRGGFQGRGGYAPRGGRGGAAGGAPRGRGGSQAA